MRNPNYKALNTFVQIVSTGSLAKAAARLSISPSAVSHQLRMLEEALELTLTIKSGRQLTLTSDGQRLFDGIAGAFEQIDQSIAKLKPEKENGLKITTPPSFYASWLAPRLAGFTAAHPDIDITISGTSRELDLSKGEWDLAIRWKSDVEVSIDTQNHELLWKENLGCVVAPQWVSESGLLNAESLIGCPIINASAFPDHWNQWVQGTKNIKRSPGSESVVDSRSNVLKAVGDGVGIAAIDVMLADLQLHDGTLLEPVRHRVQLNTAYWMLSSPLKRESTQCQIFKSWLIDEVKAAQQRLAF